MTFNLRLATLADIPALRTLITVSVNALHPAHYTPQQITLALTKIYGVDTQLIHDGHYFIVHPSSSDPTIIACGGWSNRSTLFGSDAYSARDDNVIDSSLGGAAKIRAFFVHPDWTRKGVAGLILRECEGAARREGFRRAEMGATLSGVAFYRRMGYAEVDLDGDGSGRYEVELDEGVKIEYVKLEKEFL